MDTNGEICMYLFIHAYCFRLNNERHIPLIVFQVIDMRNVKVALRSPRNRSRLFDAPR